MRDLQGRRFCRIDRLGYLRVTLLLLGAVFWWTSVAAQHRPGKEVLEAAVPSAIEKGSQHTRVPIPPDQWPWSAVGRINIAITTQRSFCTGTLVGPRTVVTAAHCLVDERLNEWVKPEAVHFVAGLSPSNNFVGHSTVRAYVTSPRFQLGSQTGSRPDYQYRRQDRPNSIQRDRVKNDWAILTLVDALQVRTIPIEPVPNADLPGPGGGNKIVLPGYGADRPFLLSISRDCSARTDVRELGEGSLVHSCDTFHGGSGSPVLLLQNGSAMLIGISTAATFDGTPNTPAHGGLVLLRHKFRRMFR
jgi:protease YdgD